VRSFFSKDLSDIFDLGIVDSDGVIHYKGKVFQNLDAWCSEIITFLRLEKPNDLSALITINEKPLSHYKEEFRSLQKGERISAFRKRKSPLVKMEPEMNLPLNSTFSTTSISSNHSSSLTSQQGPQRSATLVEPKIEVSSVSSSQSHSATLQPPLSVQCPSLCNCNSAPQLENDTIKRQKITLGDVHSSGRVVGPQHQQVQHQFYFLFTFSYLLTSFVVVVVLVLNQ
jgi:hypothetical protein